MNEKFPPFMKDYVVLNLWSGMERASAEIFLFIYMARRQKEPRESFNEIFRFSSAPPEIKNREN